jgi:hypothetical protein
MQLLILRKRLLQVTAGCCKNGAAHEVLFKIIMDVGGSVSGESI